MNWDWSNIVEWFSRYAGKAPAYQVQLLQTAVALVFLYLCRRLVLRVVLRRSDEPTYRYQWIRNSRVISFALALLIIGRIWIQGFGTLVTYFGILSAGLAIALQDLLKNLAGWVFLLWRRPFRLGDRIQIGEQAGDVIDIRIFQFTILEIGNWVAADQSTGRIIHVPNGRLFTDSVSNFYAGFEYIWSELPILITFESDWRKAKKLLLKIAEENGSHLTEAAERQVLAASEKYMIFYTRLTPIVYTSVQDSGVLLTMRFLAEPRQRRQMDEQMWEHILTEFGRHSDIDFAYPTRRFFDHRLEGKEAQSENNDGRTGPRET